MIRAFTLKTISMSLLTCSVATLTIADMPAYAAATADADNDGEIIVTAQKRVERLQDTPVPVTALSASALVERNQTRLQDYFAQVPGLSLNAQGDGTTVIILRGIATANFGNPTVAVSVDDVPYGSSTALAGGQLLQPDLDPADLQRIEVLRGPQGTLYGASSLGGLIKYVTTDPSTTELSGRVQGDFNATQDGGIGYGVRDSVNVPINEKFALRATGFSRRTAGYVDNVFTGKDDVNALDARGGRISLLWKPTETLSIKLGALHQYSHGHGASLVTTDVNKRLTLGDLNQSLLPGSGSFKSKSTLFTGNIDLDLDWADLKSVTGYGRNSYFSGSDYSRLYASFTPSSVLYNDMKTRKFTQEIRLSSPADQTLEWLVGGFYTHERSPVTQILDAVDGTTAATASNLLTAYFPTTYNEISVFGDVTYHVTQAFNVQVGARYSHNKQGYDEVDTGPLGEAAPGVPFVTSASSKDHAITFLVVPQYKFSRHAPTAILPENSRWFFTVWRAHASSHRQRRRS
ncbi:TonB-dependent receptor [Sphingobium yanoikuyae]|uniref:TonB-dependent receptor n=1 Tax=Sphingobium yanoikuyae TaxID=13690 RepID=A0A6M4G3D6_SPHYA|nr:TonB-dependent receptor plug domain-containing protein [Sphingobium yanoikuyae]QJR01862.1 TonB-dependent receptor [Sphingobium yanoikuyae]